jgi:hypothetical protein
MSKTKEFILYCGQRKIRSPTEVTAAHLIFKIPKNVSLELCPWK